MTQSQSQATSPTPLTEVVLGFLTPLMLAAGLTDAGLGRLAAQEAIAAVPAETNLISAGQIVAFAMAALDSLRLSAGADVAISTRLRLRGNANALSRTSQHAAAPSATTPYAPDPKPAPSPQPAPNAQPAGTPSARAIELAWADAMTDVAAECARSLASLPRQQRRAELIRINALKATARQIRGQTPATPPKQFQPNRSARHPDRGIIPQDGGPHRGTIGAEAATAGR